MAIAAGGSLLPQPCAGGREATAASCRPEVAAAESTRPSPLPFSLEDAPGGSAHSRDAYGCEYDARRDIEAVRAACLPTTIAQAKLAAAVAACRAAATAARGPEAAALWALGCELRSRAGYAVRLRTTLGPRRQGAYLQTLCHSFLVVRGGGSGAWEGEPPGCELVVDLNFRESFRQARSRPWYDALLAALPRDFVGPLPALAAAAGAAAAATRLLCAQLGAPLPPWRELGAVLSKWVPPAGGDGYEDTLVPLLAHLAPTAAVDLASRLAPYHAAPRRSAAVAAADAMRHAAFAAAFVVRRGARAGQPRRVDGDACTHEVVIGFHGGGGSGDDGGATPFGAEAHRLRRSSAPAAIIGRAASGAATVATGAPAAAAGAPVAQASVREATASLPGASATARLVRCETAGRQGGAAPWRSRFGWEAQASGARWHCGGQEQRPSTAKTAACGGSPSESPRQGSEPLPGMPPLAPQQQPQEESLGLQALQALSPPLPLLWTPAVPSLPPPPMQTLAPQPQQLLRQPPQTPPQAAAMAKAKAQPLQPQPQPQSPVRAPAGPHFPPLDDLLPRVRTVRLVGVAR